MSKLWINNELVDRLAMLQQTEKQHIGMNQVAIEKDWWVTVTLKALFQTECANALIFKGGTSLSKGFGIIERFSEDIDLAIHHSYFGIESTSKSQREKLRKRARQYIHETLATQLKEQLTAMGITQFEIENLTHVQGKDGMLHPIDTDKDPTVIYLNYVSVVESSISYIPPRVKIEISALSMDEPTEVRNIQSLINETFKEEDDTSSCEIRTVVPTRTFLEKIFLLAEELQKEKPRSMRMSRHLYDLERLMDTQYGIQALQDKDLYERIVHHRRSYYALKYVDYDKLNPNTINFTIPTTLQETWRADYQEMQRSFIYGPTLDFDALMKRIHELQNRIRKLSKEIEN